MLIFYVYRERYPISTVSHAAFYISIYFYMIKFILDIIIDK